MSTEANIAATRRLIDEGFTGGNLDVCDELVAPVTIEHQRGLKPGIEGAKQTIRMLHDQFSDFELRIVELAAMDDRVWIVNRATGVNTGSMYGRPATGKPIDITVIDVLRFEDGKIVEHWGVPDQLGALMQVGLFGRPEPVLV